MEVRNKWKNSNSGGFVVWLSDSEGVELQYEFLNGKFKLRPVAGWLAYMGKDWERKKLTAEEKDNRVDTCWELDAEEAKELWAKFENSFESAQDYDEFIYDIVSEKGGESENADRKVS